MTELIQTRGLAESFHEYVFMMDAFDRERIFCKKVKGFLPDIERLCTPECVKQFNWLLEYPNTVGASNAYEELMSTNPPIPHCEEIRDAFSVLNTAVKPQAEAVQIFPGCKSKKQSKLLNDVVKSFTEDTLLGMWERFNAAIGNDKEERRLSREARKTFKNGDKVKYISGVHEGTFGILVDVNSDWDQCSVKDVKTDEAGNPLWSMVERSYSCGFYQELVHVEPLSPARAQRMCKMPDAPVKKRRIVESD